MSHGVNEHASTRVMLWQRLQHWALGVAQFGAADSRLYRDDTPA